MLIKNIKIEIPYRNIYARLGYMKATSEINDSQKTTIDSSIKEAFLKIDCSGVFVKHRIDVNGNVISVGGCRWVSDKLSDFLRDYTHIYLVAVTAGIGIGELIERAKLEDRMTDYVIYDAAGSECVEEGVEWMENYIRKHSRMTDIEFTKHRFSPGYGDFDLKYQSDIIELTKAGSIGINLTETMIMYPEKSVTAVIGVKSLR